MKTEKIESLQFARALAAIGIVLFHTEYGLWQSMNWGVSFFLSFRVFL